MTRTASTESDASSRPRGPRVLLGLRGVLENYPPSINQANLLAEAGWEVTVVDAHSPAFDGHSGLVSDKVRRVRAVRAFIGVDERVPPLYTRMWRRWRFRRALQKEVRRRRPSVIIAYDVPGCEALSLTRVRRKGINVIFHLHEQPDLNRNLSRGMRRATEFVFKHASEADLVTFPDRDRAKAFARQAGLAHVPTVVMNCPRRIRDLPGEGLTPVLAEMGFRDRRVVYFQGYIGRKSCLKETVQSMRHWPEDAILVLVGPVTSEFRAELISISREAGVQGKIVFFGRKPYNELWALLRGAHVALSLIRPFCLNYWLCAGAINKRFEYMAAGVAQVSNVGPGVAEIVEQTGAGVCVPHDSPKAIADAVGQILRDDSMRRAMARAGREAHLTRFNYEAQFGPVLEKMQAMSRQQ